MITFDPINHRVSLNSETLTLQPLSYRLLETLAGSPGVIIAVDELIKAVWGNVTVSADTLKQRIFVLRKAIEQSAISGIEIQAVRNEGYRLIVTPAATPLRQRNRRLRLGLGLAGLALLCVGLVMLALTLRQAETPLNNRIVLWSNTPVQSMPGDAAAVYEHWRSMLSRPQQPVDIQLILSERQSDMLVPVQARKNRAALISHYEVVSLNDTVVVRLSIIEPTTATILRSQLLEVSGDSYKVAMQQQYNAIAELLASGLLPPDNAQRENAQDPIWARLKQLANPG
ncbi:winged helix-turn-helix domain-containing protein [Rheinheimera sp. NSM]|uniref:winged helix-turn-helix domain-containing protein n=1 Tax=Rheinheimera sp. NSM TaxID=3457884 RepID=UPI00403616C8